MQSTDIYKYYEWLEKVQKVVEDHVLLVTKNSKDSSLLRNTDDLNCNGYSLKGQDIETSPLTGNIFIKPTLLTFAHWLEQYEQLKG